MKHITAVFVLFALLMLAGCLGSQVPVSSEPTVILPSETATSIPKPIATDTSVPTALPTITLAPTLPVNPENLVLAEKGYDIADVRLSFPREDMVVIDFKYRLDESRRSKATYIYMTVPPTCMDDDNKNVPPNHITRNLTGSAQFTLKLTFEGDCTADSIEFRFYSDPNTNQSPLFREYVLQSYHLVRGFPTVNSDTLRVENLKFTSQSQWDGSFTFDYAVSEEIPFPLEQYSISAYAFGPDGDCFIEVRGPILVTHTGEYRIDMNLYRDLSSMDRNCIDRRDHYTYTATHLAVRDDIANRMVYHQTLNVPFPFVK